MSKEMVDFLVAAQRMDKQQEREFMEKLKPVLSEEELKSLAILISYFRIQLHPDMKKAMVKAMAETLYNHFNRLTA